MKKIILLSLTLIAFANCNKKDVENNDTNLPTKVVPKTITEVYHNKYENKEEVTVRNFYYNGNSLARIEIIEDGKKNNFTTNYDSNGRYIGFERSENYSLVFKNIVEYNAEGKIAKETTIEPNDETSDTYTYENGKLSKKFMKGKHSYSYGNGTIDKIANNIEDRYSYPSESEIHIERFGYFEDGDILKINEFEETYNAKKQLIKKVKKDIDIFYNTIRTDNITTITYDNYPIPYANVDESLKGIIGFEYGSTINNILTVDEKYRRTKYNYEYNAKGYPSKITKLINQGVFNVSTQSTEFDGNFEVVEELTISYYNE